MSQEIDNLKIKIAAQEAKQKRIEDKLAELQRVKPYNEERIKYLKGLLEDAEKNENEQAQKQATESTEKTKK